MKTHNHVRQGNPWQPTTMYVMAHSLMLLGVFKILQLIQSTQDFCVLRFLPLNECEPQLTSCKVQKLLPSRRCDDNTSDHEQEASAPKSGIGQWHNQQPLLPGSTKSKTHSIKKAAQKIYSRLKD